MTKEQKLEQAIKKLLACPAIADGSHGEPAWGCKETAEAEAFARAALSAPKAEAVKPTAVLSVLESPLCNGRKVGHIREFGELIKRLPVGEYPLYTSPVPDITDEAVERASEAIAGAWGENWACCCIEQRGLDCDCGDAMNEDREGRPYDEDLTREDCRMAARAALLAAIRALGGGNKEDSGE